MRITFYFYFLFFILYYYEQNMGIFYESKREKHEKVKEKR